MHVVPPVPAAVKILQDRFTYYPCRHGAYILSGTDGLRPQGGWSKTQARIRQAICAETGSRVVVPWKSHYLRRTVATRIAEALGVGDEQMFKRVLGHADGTQRFRLR